MRIPDRVYDVVLCSDFDNDCAHEHYILVLVYKVRKRMVLCKVNETTKQRIGKFAIE